MSRKYYLDDVVEYQPDSGELLVDGRIENLQSLENKLLLHFVTHPNQLIDKEKLYEVGWDGRIHGDNPLSKAISNIRSKLNDSPKNPRYIKTIPKKGFKFISSVSDKPIALQSVGTLESGQNWQNLAKLFVLLSIIIVLFYLVADQLFNREASLSPQKISDFKQLTFTDNSQERDPHLSYDGKAVIFSRKGQDSNWSQLVLKPLPGGEERRLTDNRFDNKSPIWHPDGKRILYHRFNPNQCEIAIIELDDRLNVISDIMLTNCGKYSTSLGLSWGPDNSIYYSDTDLQFAAHKIYRLNLDSGKREIVAMPPENDGRGYYRIHYDKQSSQLYALLSVGWYDTAVVTLNLQGEILDRHEVGMPLFSISSYNGMPVFRSADNHIRYLENGKEQLMMQSPLYPIFAPHFTEGQQAALAFVGGVLHNRKLVQIDFENQTEQAITEKAVAHKLPVLTRQNNLYYISNELGVYQVWRRDGKEPQVLSQFLENRNFSGLAISSDEQYIALTIGEDIHIYQLGNLPLRPGQPYMMLENSGAPHFSPDGKSLWFHTREDTTFYLESVDLSQKRKSGIKIAHGYLGLFDQANGRHLIFKYEQPGAWTIVDSQLQWYANAPLMSSMQSTVLDNNILTYFDDAKAQLVQLNLETSKQALLSKGPYRFVTKQPGRENRWVVTKDSFGNTDIFIAVY